MSAAVACNAARRGSDDLFLCVPTHEVTHLFQLKQFGGLHQMLQLESAFWHVMRLAPLFDTSDIVLYLHRWTPRISDSGQSLSKD